MVAWDSKTVQLAALSNIRQRWSRIQQFIFIYGLLIFALSGCSTSNDSDEKQEDDQTPIEKIATLGDTVSLSAVEISSEPVDSSSVQLTFEWIFISKPEGSLAVLSDANTANPNFIADLPGEYLLQLTIWNNGIVLVQTPVTVIVNDNNEPDPDEPNVPQKPDNHLLSSDSCNLCHDPNSWDIDVVDHSQVIGTCVSCHNGVDASGKGNNHIHTTNTCDACHEPGPRTWTPVAPAAVDHTQVFGDCADCHNESVIMDFTHPFPVTEDCSVCHNTTSWTTSTIDHNSVVGTCVSCHDGVIASGKSANHIPSTDLCDACHQTSPVTWAPVASTSVDHTQVIGECADCHDGPIPIPIDFVHPINTTSNCSACHNTTSWSPASVDHNEVIGTCASCHDGVIAKGKGLDHIVTTADCHICHGTVRWVYAAVDHSTFTSDICIECHTGDIASGKTETHISSTDLCGACHAPFPALWTPAAFVDHSQVIGECSSCHNGVLAKGKSDTHVETTAQCDTCHLINNGELTWLITDAACIGVPDLAGTMKQVSSLASTVFPDLEITFSTKEVHYGLTSKCAPIFLEMTNIGNEPLILTTEQATTFSSLTVGLYRTGRFLSVPFTHASAANIEPGQFLAPGESTYFNATLTKDQLDLYSIPPPGGGMIQDAINIQGPQGPGSLGMFSIDRIDFTYDVDFGLLPNSRVYDAGAGIEFAAGQLIVAFNQDMALTEAEDLIRKYDCHLYTEILPMTFLVAIPFDKTTSQVITEFTNEPLVRYAEKNYIYNIDPITGGGGVGIN